MALIGLRKVIRSLNRAIDRLDDDTKNAILAGLALARARSELLTPVDKGNLKASHYVDHNTDKSVIQIGLTANYATYVHEDLNARHRVGEAKFLEKALRATERDFVRLIKKTAL